MISRLKVFDKLDCQVKLSYRSESKFSELSKKFKIQAFVGISFGKDSTESTFIISEGTHLSRDATMFLSQYNAIEKDGIWRIRRETREPDESVEIIRDILEVPSSVLTDIWLSEGWYRAGFIFHHSHLKLVSDVLTRHAMSNRNLIIDYLGHTESFASIFNRINSAMELYVAEVRHTAPAEELKSPINPTGSRWFRVLKNPFGSAAPIGVYITDQPPEDLSKVTPIAQEGIYIANSDNSYSKYMNREANERKVVTIGRFHDFRKPDFRVTVFMPAMIAKEWLEIWDSSLDTFSSWKPSLEAFLPFSEWSINDEVAAYEAS